MFKCTSIAIQISSEIELSLEAPITSELAGRQADNPLRPFDQEARTYANLSWKIITVTLQLNLILWNLKVYILYNLIVIEFTLQNWDLLVPF